jgi:hypothetical protein
LRKAAWHSATGKRTTLDRNDDRLAEAKALAARERRSLTRPIEQRLALRRRQGKGTAAARRTVPVHADRGGLSSAVRNRRSNRSLLDGADGLPTA